MDEVRVPMVIETASYDAINMMLTISFLPTEAECWQFGRQWLKCRIEVE